MEKAKIAFLNFFKQFIRMVLQLVAEQFHNIRRTTDGCGTIVTMLSNFLTGAGYYKASQC
jgi:hypothetical protein